MEDGMLKIPENNLRVGTYRLIQINKMLPFLGLQAKSYDIGDLNKIIVKSLSPRAMGNIAKGKHTERRQETWQLHLR